jgi:hypothetical protein
MSILEKFRNEYMGGVTANALQYKVDPLYRNHAQSAQQQLNAEKEWHENTKEQRKRIDASRERYVIEQKEKAQMKKLLGMYAKQLHLNGVQLARVSQENSKLRSKHEQRSAKHRPTTGVENLLRQHTEDQSRNEEPEYQPETQGVREPGVRRPRANSSGPGPEHSVAGRSAGGQLTDGGTELRKADEDE